SAVQTRRHWLRAGAARSPASWAARSPEPWAARSPEPWAARSPEPWAAQSTEPWVAQWQAGRRGAGCTALAPPRPRTSSALRSSRSHSASKVARLRSFPGRRPSRSHLGLATCGGKHEEVTLELGQTLLAPEARASHVLVRREALGQLEVVLDLGLGAGRPERHLRAALQPVGDHVRRRKAQRLASPLGGPGPRLVVLHPFHRPGSDAGRRILPEGLHHLTDGLGPARAGE